MTIDERVKAMFALEESIELLKEHRLMPHNKLAFIDKVIEEQVEIIIETDPSKIPGTNE